MCVTVVDPCNVVNDPAMPSLAPALDPVTVAHQFNRRLKALTSDGGEIRLRGIRVVRYKPKRRCVIEYGVTIHRHGADEEMALIGKVRVRRFGKSGYRRLKALWEAGFGDNSPDGISVPQPVGTVSEFHMWLQRKVPGTVATDLLTGADATVIARRVAEAAHKIHQAKIPLETEHTTEDEVRILRERLPAVWEGEPRLRSRINAVLEASSRLAATIPVVAPGVIHRDFYSDQVIVDGDRLYLLDFDLCCLGDAALDMGNFIGHVTEQSLRTLGNAAALQPVEQALQERYVELHGEACRPAVQAYTTLTLVRHIYLSTLFPERRPFTDRILDLCESRLQRGVKAIHAG